MRVDTEPEPFLPATSPSPASAALMPASAALMMGILRRLAAGSLIAGSISLATCAWPRDEVDSIVLAWLCACADHPLRTAVACALLIGALGPALDLTRDASSAR